MTLLAKTNDAKKAQSVRICACKIWKIYWGHSPKTFKLGIVKEGASSEPLYRLRCFAPPSLARDLWLSVVCPLKIYLYWRHCE